jgi:hypothetical protein
MAEKSFTEFLREKRRIADKHIPYYERWVAMYSSRAGQDPHSVQGEEDTAVRSFLSSLESRYEDWQVRQAWRALQLYFYYCGRRISNLGPGILRPEAPTDSTRQALRANMIQSIRLKHLSLRTEKSYLSWVSRFLDFLGREDGKNLNERDLKTFLSYLAVARKVSAATQR